MAPHVEGEVLSRIEFVLPKNVVQTAFHLARGIGATFLSTNLQRKTATHIKLFKKHDESVSINCTVTALRAEQLHQPEHILIDQVKEKLPPPDRVQGLSGDPDSPNTAGEPSAEAAAVQSIQSFLGSTSIPVSDSGCVDLHHETVSSSSITMVPESRIPDSLMAHDDVISPEKIPPGEFQEVSPRKISLGEGTASDQRAQQKVAGNAMITLDLEAHQAVEMSHETTKDGEEFVPNVKEDVVRTVQEVKPEEKGRVTGDVKRKRDGGTRQQLQGKRRKESGRKSGSEDVSPEERDTREEESPRRSGRTSHLPARLATSQLFSKRTRKNPTPMHRDESNPQEGETSAANATDQSNVTVHANLEGESHQTAKGGTRPDETSGSQKEAGTLRDDDAEKASTNESAETTPKHKVRKTEKTTPCPLCTYMLRDYEALFDHVKKQHLKHAQCEVHLTEIREKMKTTCDICGREISRASAMKSHMTTMHVDHSEATCVTCGVNVKSQRHLELHVKRCHRETKRSHLCHLCPASFKVKAYLATHLQNVHTEASSSDFQCDLCPKAFNTERYLKTHKLRVHGPKKHPCLSCGMGFSELSNLRRHVALIHDAPKRKQHFCPHCSKGFTLKSNLKEHIQTIHLRQYPFQCAVCGEGFSRRRQFEAHRSESHRQGACFKQKRTTGSGGGNFIALTGDANQAGHVIEIRAGQGTFTVHTLDGDTTTMPTLTLGGSTAAVQQTSELQLGSLDGNTLVVDNSLQSLGVQQQTEEMAGAGEEIVTTESGGLGLLPQGSSVIVSSSGDQREGGVSSSIVTSSAGAGTPPEEAVQVCIVATPEMLEAFGIQDEATVPNPS